MTSQELDDIASRLAKGWVIRRDQIEALIAVARRQVASATVAPYCVRCDTDKPCTNISCPIKWSRP